MKALAASLSAALIVSAGAGEVRVTGQLRSVNGATEVPIGLFGVHATPVTAEMAADWGIESVRLIDQRPSGKPVVAGAHERVPAGIRHIVECFYDRYQPALVLTERDWKKNLETLARTYGENAKTAGGRHYVEFWNEPYLNWAKKPGVNYDGAFYEQADMTPGTPMTIQGWDRPLDSLIWDRQVVAVDAEGQVDYLASSYALPLVWRGELHAGDTYVFRETKTLTMKEMPWGRDPAQQSFYSGPQNSQFYRWMFIPFARALKAANPDVQVIGGWGMHFNQNGWAAWDTLFKPLIDESIQWLDGLDEHHYGGDTRMIAGNYETVAAYAATVHGKRLQFYNTEAGGQLDPERPANAALPKFHPTTGAERLAGATYMLRDIIHLVDVCPDKAAARASHEATASGEESAFRLLKPLRGKLMAAESGEPKIWCVASLAGNRLSVVVFNDNNGPRKFPLTVKAPGGGTFTGGSMARIALREGEPAIVESAVEAGGGEWSATVELGAKSAMRWTFDCAPGGEIATVEETQFFAKGVINKVEPGQPVELEVALPEVGVREARLRIVQVGWDNGTSVCELNGKEIPVQVTASYLHEQPLDASTLQPVNTLVFKTRDGAKKGFAIDMASIVLRGGGR